MSKVLTISIAAYNVEKYIEKCLKSFSNHKFDDILEVFIIDDGGKDGTVKIAQKFAMEFPDIFTIIKKDNGGWGSTVNWGIMHANGRYFRVLDGDDYFNPETLERYLDILSKEESDIIFTPFKLFDDTSGKIFQEEKWRVPVPVEKKVQLYKVIEDMPLVMHACAVKTKLLQNNYHKLLEYCFYTDTEYMIKVLYRADTIAFYDIPVYFYRIGRNEQSVSYATLVKRYSEHEKVLFRIISIYSKHKNNKKNKAIENKILNMINLQYRIYLNMSINSQNKNLLILFDKKLSEQKELYPTNSKIIKILRLSNFVLYPPAAKYEQIKNKGEKKFVY